ncbi:unnamed protein product [Calicophoron daubneyi]|uniref:Uncharacterized protein n=1 Tax=Calicophoron daubneyi TaxID=300641 RepID=A0AAV2TSS0_CALDB
MLQQIFMVLLVMSLCYNVYGRPPTYSIVYPDEYFGLPEDAGSDLYSDYQPYEEKRAFRQLIKKVGDPQKKNRKSAAYDLYRHIILPQNEFLG